MKRVSLASCLLSLCVPGLAHAATAVYPGCAVPNLKAGHRTFYVDPVKGTPDGDGSAAKPWKTLADVLDPTGKFLSTQSHKKAGGTDPLYVVKPSNPIKSGDVVMLMSGNHGAVKIQNAFNTDFITVMAAPGQTPILTQLNVMSATKWLFQGIKFQAQDPSPAPATINARDTLNLVAVGVNEWQGSSSDVIFTGGSFSTSDDSSQWSDRDWLLKPYYDALAVNKTVTCMSVTNNRFYNVLNALAQSGDNSLIQGNTFEKFSNDAIEIMASNSTIKGNIIRGNVSPLSVTPWHADAIQGWSLSTTSGPKVNTNVVIDGNTITKTGDPNKSWMQGISIYDGKWKNLVIQNNVVVTNTWHGIAVYGAESAKIVNNTVLASEPSSRMTWIRVSPGKDGTHSTNVIVRNNLSSTLFLDDTGTTVDHNTVNAGYPMLSAGKVSMVTKTNTALKNIIDPTFTSDFVQINNTSGAYDLRLRPSSPFIGSGLAASAPSTDIAGKNRTVPTDLGAYNH